MQSPVAPALLSLTLPKFGSVVTVGVSILLFPRMVHQSNSVVRTLTSFRLGFALGGMFSLQRWRLLNCPVCLLLLKMNFATWDTSRQEDFFFLFMTANLTDLMCLKRPLYYIRWGQRVVDKRVSDYYSCSQKNNLKIQHFHQESMMHKLKDPTELNKSVFSFMLLCIWSSRSCCCLQRKLSLAGYYFTEERSPVVGG